MTKDKEKQACSHEISKQENLENQQVFLRLSREESGKSP